MPRLYSRNFSASPPTSADAPRYDENFVSTATQGVIAQALEHVLVDLNENNIDCVCHSLDVHVAKQWDDSQTTVCQPACVGIGEGHIKEIFHRQFTDTSTKQH
jgi:hypothetical protein